MVPMPEASCDTSQSGSQKNINRFWKLKVAELDMQATHDGNAHPSPCNKTLSMAKTLELNNPVILIQPVQADSTTGKNFRSQGESLVWFWIIDETVVLTSILSVCVDLMRLVHAKYGARNGHCDDGDDHKMIKCSTWKRRKRTTKLYGVQDKGIV